MTAEFHVHGPVIVGAGLAGLSCAIELAPAPCLVLSAGALSTGTSTGWAQGGLAAAIGAEDSPALHAADTIAAGAGLCDPDVVRSITAAAPESIEWLSQLGARWDRNPDGSVRLGLEGAHGRRRIVHANGDGSGAELLRAVLDAARALPSIALWEHCRAVEIVVRDGRVAGVRVATPDGEMVLRTPAVVLATGGIGGLFTHTTNPLTSRGQGLALAFRAGAVLRDLELVQFHPTALDVALDPMPLVSEAVRGEGAVLVDEHGDPVLTDSLAARDVVSRAAWAQLRAGRGVFLDARRAPGARFAELFPAIHAGALRQGLDPVRDPLPVRPAAHYHMGGVLVDECGASTVPGLFAAGEVASTGLHGANRLASNSLLEAVVCGRRVANHLAATMSFASASNPVRGWGRPARRPEDPLVGRLRGIVTAGAGVLRDADGLRASMAGLRPHLDHEVGLVGYLVAASALRRQESRGAHTRTDDPATAPVAEHTLISWTDLLAVPEPVRSAS